jgi:hypothetical protein
MCAERNVNIHFANVSSTLTLATLIFPHFLPRYWLDTMQFKFKKHWLISHLQKAMPTLPTLFPNSKHNWLYYYRPSKCTFEPPKTFFVLLLTIFIEYLQTKTEISKPRLGLLRFQARPKPTSSPHPDRAWLGLEWAGLSGLRAWGPAQHITRQDGWMGVLPKHLDSGGPVVVADQGMGC